jgi:HK97 family phage prohead protease
MNRKALRGRAMVKDAAQGIAEIVISAYGNVDHDRDIVEVGACSKQIAGEYGPNPKGMLDHDWSMRSAVAKTLRWWEENDGTHVEAQYNLDKEIGRDAFSDLQFYGDDMEFSVGYEIKARRAPTAEEKAMGARQVITEWQINEWSHVMLGANSETRLVAAKAKTEQGAKATQAKAVVGSYEYLSDRLTDALSEQFAAAWLWVRATFPDHVLFSMERCGEQGEWQYGVYDVTYTAADGIYTFGELVEVRTAEVIEPKTDEPTEPTIKQPLIDAQRVKEFRHLVATTR